MENQMSVESKEVKVEQHITVNIGGSSFNLNQAEAAKLRDALNLVLGNPISPPLYRRPVPKLSDPWPGIVAFDRGREFEIWCEAGPGVRA